jgi:hypothetical protein
MVIPNMPSYIDDLGLATMLDQRRPYPIGEIFSGSQSACTLS